MQMVKLEEVFLHRSHFLITTESAEQQQECERFTKTYFVTDVNEWRWLRNPLKFLWVILQTLRIFWIERPNVVISTGAGIAVPAFLLGFLLRAKTIYVEDGARVQSPSRTGMVCYYLADIFFIQHPEMAKQLPRATYKGALCENLSS